MKQIACQGRNTELVAWFAVLEQAEAGQKRQPMIIVALIGQISLFGKTP